MTPFYKKALALFTHTQKAQIQKGLDKYPNPFNPSDWSPEELLNHALEETVDLTHYLVGLKELLDAKTDEIDLLKLKVRQQEKTISDLSVKVWREERAKRPVRNLTSEGKLPYDLNFNPHFDQDDQ